ncbi:helix-turn-helix transcriptional regulator [Salmonella enterica]|uniref:helix-turn-helix transcriptional regulator n=1 Tax=Salmonella enterica TaxID=28901 RepID=UPI0019F83D60|nr:helix-turn-helix transcriptional regulator [Salmonella enterica]EHE6193660.1 helix-turn-helix transcriptional regulator [Salmonella enterica]
MLKDVLKSRRNALQLKQAEVAKYVKVTPQTYLKWESGEYEPKASQVRKLAEILHVTESEICKGYLYNENGYDLINFMRKASVGLKYVDTISITELMFHFINDKNEFIRELDKELKFSYGFSIDEFREKKLTSNEERNARLAKKQIDDENDILL